MKAHTKEAVRVKVKKCEQNRIPEWRKFSVDPQITSLEVLYSLLAKAFEIKCDFSIKYKAFDPAGNEIYLAVLSDWDLDAAFLRIHNIAIQTATEPCLTLQIDIKPFTEVKEWDGDPPLPPMTSMVSGGAGGAGAAASARELMSPLQQSFGVSQKYMQTMQTKLPGLIMNQMEKTFSIVQKAFNLSDETMASLPPRAPLSDNEFRLFLDALGQIQRTDELRKVIFFGGIDPSLRRVVWKHILNVYPHGMSGQQRMNFMRRKSEQYYALRETWKTAIKQGCVAGDLAYVTGMVKKDVLRTDRLHPFYAGSDDNQNIASLFNILTTYALNHPAVNYCQGMSDIASPLLVTMNDEAQAYICFCAIMGRVRGNFMIDGIAMTQKFAHLTEALSFYDPEFWEYLKAQQADDLLFCYRWLLLEMKREFPFEDALRMLEVQWSSLKYEMKSETELSLYEKEFMPLMDESSNKQSSVGPLSSMGPPPISPSYLTKPRENPYTKVCALRRQSSLASLSSLSTSSTSATPVIGLNTSKRLNHSLDDNMSRHASRRRHRHSSGKSHQSLDESRMMQLIESAQQLEEAESEEVRKPAEEREDTDDEVFTSSEPKPAPNEDEEAFIFHPTNPFKDDAKTQTSGSGPTPCPQNVPSVFRESSTSSTPPKEGDGLMSNLSKAGQIPRSIAKLHNKNILSNYNAVSNIITKQLASQAQGMVTGGGGHFRDLKEKIAASSRKGLSFDENNEETHQQKLVKNFNEFLNFAANKKNTFTDKLNTSTNPPTSVTHSKTTPSLATYPAQSLGGSKLQSTPAYPLLQVSKNTLGSSVDDDSEEESSSVPDTTWSGSTAATAIQQTNNWSMNSLHLELNSLSSATHTPDRTPVAERKLHSDSKHSLAALNATSPQVNDLSSTPDDSQDQDQEYYPMSTAITRELRLDADNLDRQVFGMEVSASLRTTKESSREIEYEKLGRESLDLVEDLKENEIRVLPDVSELLRRRRNRLATNDTSASVSSSTSTTTSSNVNSNRDSSWYRSYVDEGEGEETADDEATPSGSLHQSSDNNMNGNAAKAAVVNVNVTKAPAHPPPAMRTISLDAGTVNAASGGASQLNPFIDDPLYDETLRLPNSNSLPEVLVPISTDSNDGSPAELATNASDEIAFSKSPQNMAGLRNGMAATPLLPPPTEFGGGNPFLMFLCLTLLLQHRNTIMKTGMDYNEIAMHFDKMVRKHDVTRVLNQARRMYIDYLKMQSAYKPQQQQSPTQQAAAEGAGGDINRNSPNPQQRNTPAAHS